MEIIKLIDLLESDPQFIEWKKEHDEFYLAHIFKLFDKQNEDTFQIGYYSDKLDKITTFHVSDKVNQIIPEAEVFKKEKSIIELKKEDIKIDLNQAIKHSQDLKKEKYKNQIPMKMFVILQNIPKHGLVYNITYINQTFTTLNVKVSATDAEVKEEKLTSLMDFKAKNQNI